jgi:hypothetical protein
MACSGYNVGTFLGTHKATSVTTSCIITPSLKMGSTPHKKATLKQPNPPSTIQTTAPSKGIGFASPTVQLNPEDGRPVTHRIDTKGSVQALVVNNGIIVAGLQDGTLAVSLRRFFVLI